MPIKSVEITEDQAEWLEEHPINFSQLVRKLLTTYMSKHRKAYEMSQEEIREHYNFTKETEIVESESFEDGKK